MARMERPALLGICECGEMCIQFDGEDPYWTKSESIRTLFAQTIGTKQVSCPGHGGDPSIKMSGGFHPRFFETPVAA